MSVSGESSYLVGKFFWRQEGTLLSHRRSRPTLIFESVDTHACGDIAID